jgi:hypothetical protein
LFAGEKNGKVWRRKVEEAFHGDDTPKSVSDLLYATLHHIPDEVLDAPPQEPPLPEGYGPHGGTICPLTDPDEEQRC